ncbi:ABC transporter substrate-binding protein [Pseudotabrizicola alkalilacus]|uniref:Branched-chain amino acid ABC transporter substrate-binding protein n=1 Tax=Pseudotabrizicola alkalilacus TaxID=2305252 RepID=A0A411Z4S4_9RHOB|nr:ABC transporter substrate-binding protein [Pseudotabrizicola alkalilacus]RGP38054.1 branched-chain amino acid ABC transporter substrate-binding protein [Pseudotabrizicola alkalilacus]
MTAPSIPAAICAALWLGTSAMALAQQARIDVPMLYLRQEVDLPPVLSNLDPQPEDLGLAGAEVALKDNQTTGSFLGHDYALTVVSVAPGGDLAAAARDAFAAAPFVLVDGTAADVLTVADLPEAAGKLIFNVSAGDARLRSEDCRANVLHTIPEDAARTDALMQVLQAKQWRKLALITGPKPADQAFADALRRSAAKFGLTITGEKPWTFDTDLRESTMAELPRFTQDLPDHDVLLVADPTDDFGRYVQHNTWLPRPVAGTHGLHAEGWASVIEAWGAVQLQNRFEAHAKRDMRARDYAAWLAIRAVGEAVTRRNTADPASLRGFILSADFQQDGFKGRALTFRNWNGQMRQPVAVVNDRALVTMAPVEGFLHQRNETDSLGLDQPESKCTAFGR